MRKHSSDVSRFYLDQFLEHLNFERGLARPTLVAYEREVLRMVWFVLSKNKLSATQVTDQDIRDFMLYLGKSELAPTSIKRAQAALKTYFTFLEHEAIVPENPTRKISSPRSIKKVPKFMTHREMLKILDAPSIESSFYWRDKAILEFLYATGTRVSEVVSVTLTNLDLENRICLVLGKGSKERVLPIGSECCSALEHYISDLRPKLQCGNSTDILFLNQRGAGLSTRAIHQLVKTAGVAVGLKKSVSPHMFRHTFATHLLEGGADLISVKELLGHSDISTTQMYTHVDRKHLQEMHRKHHPRS